MQKYLLVLLCSCSLLVAKTQTWPTPFTLQLEEVTWPDWPGLHSFAHGVHNQRWFVLYGREGGLHGMIPPDPFPIAEANRSVRMFDPESGEVWERSIFELPDSIAFPLRSTNPQFVQQNEFLYVMGGYGKDTTSDNFITFATLVAINLNTLQSALESGSAIEPAFRLYRDSLFYLCGAEAEWFNNRVYLFGGHEFTGEYTMIGGIGFTQKYSNAVRSFSLTDDGSNLSISEVQVHSDSLLFHRRDLNLAPLVFPDGSFGLAAYSGVFQYEANLPWLSNLYFDGTTWTEDVSMLHLMNNYTCPVLPMFDSITQTSYTIFFGGISQYYIDPIDSGLTEDLNVPFVSDISCIIRQPDGSAQQLVMPLHFDQLYGSNAVFIPLDQTPAYANGVLALHQFDNEQMVGYLFGGIAPDFANFTPSAASNKLYKVYIQQPPPVSVNGVPPTLLNIFPNPASHWLWVDDAANYPDYRIYDALGRCVLQGADHTTGIPVHNLTNGMYTLQCSNNNNRLPHQLFVIQK